MPELPEVEILVRHLRPLLLGRTVQSVAVRRTKALIPTSKASLRSRLLGARFASLERRGKFLIFQLKRSGHSEPFALLAHLGMTGRIFLQSKSTIPPKHAAVLLGLGGDQLVFDDPRGFGRFTLDLTSLTRLGPEPLGSEFTARYLQTTLSRSGQPIKVKLLDQSLFAGIGNIYASEALFRARIAPTTRGNALSPAQIQRLRRAVRQVLCEAIRLGSKLALNFASGSNEGLFYFGRAEGASDSQEERFKVYERAGLPCYRCQHPIRRIVQSARGTYFCANCQSVR